MAGGYEVDLDEMGKLTTTLSQAKDRMTNSTKALADLSADDLGSEEIDKAADDFQDRLGYGIGKIADLSGSLVDALTKAKNVYAEMEQKVLDSFGQLCGTASDSPRAALAADSEITRRLDGAES
jgi:hypothetical protein